MKSLKQTVWILISYYPLALAIILLNAFASQAIVFSMYTDRLSYANLRPFASNMNIVFLIFAGLYVGFGFSSFRNSYVWKINRAYRHTLIKAYLITLTLFSLIIAPLTFILAFDTKMLMFAPLCASILASMILAGSDVLHRVIIPFATFGLIILLGLNHSPTIWIMLLAASESVLHLLKDTNNYSQPIFSLHYWGSWRGMSNLAAERVSAYRYLNDGFGKLLSKQLSKQKKNLDWAVLSIHSKFGFPAIFWAIFFVIFFRHFDSDSFPVFILLIINFALTITIETKKNMAQMRYIAHVFGMRQKPHPLKTKILRTVDKSIFTNLVTMIGLMLIVLAIYQPSSKLFETSFSAALVGLIYLAINPLLMSVNFLKKSIVTMLPITACFAATYAALFYLWPLLAANDNINVFFRPELYLVIVSIILIRYFGTRYFYSLSLEHLFGRS